MTEQVQQPAAIAPHMPNVLLIGASGAGKTTALRSIVRAGLELFTVFTEPHYDMIVDPLLPHEQAMGLPPIDINRVHYRYIPPTTGSWSEMLDKAQLINSLAWDALAKMTADPNKANYSQWYNFLCTFQNFVDDRTGQAFGDVTTWGYDRAVVIDGLSGVNHMAMQFVCGGSVAKSQPQWGAAMDLELELVGRKLCYDTTCLYVLVTHLERLIDEVSGSQRLMPLALGKKVAPELPKNFNDVVHANRVGENFLWSTNSFNVDCKGRNLPMADNLPPDFAYLLQNWQARVFQQQ